MNTKYIIHSSNRAFSSLDKVLSGKAYNDARYFILCDENTYNHCLPILISHTSRLQESEFLEVPVGEEAKTIDVAMQLWKALLDSNADRKSVIINLGGGCISDLGGFVASAYKRGIRYITGRQGPGESRHGQRLPSTVRNILRSGSIQPKKKQATR